MSSIFSTAYLPSLVYFKKLINEEKIQIEAFEHFQKQTIRNRCFILSANGIQCLTVPIHQPSGKKQLIKDVEIKDDISWQRLHWRALTSSYNRSPFFEFYKEEFAVFFLIKKYKWLIEFNEELLLWLLKKMKKPIPIEKTSAYYPSMQNDFRAISNARTPFTETGENFRKYNQVFSYKFGFVKNLSTIDLLFNIGNHSLTFISEPLH